MTIHYHGGPLTPGPVLEALAGRNFCVSYAAPHQVEKCHQLGQSVMLDNGAFSMWRSGVPTNWPAYYGWVEPWLDYQTTWAIIPDVIEGDAEANDALIREWPFGQRGAPVWHLHEPIERLVDLAEQWDRICLGSSAQYAVVGTSSWHRRMEQAMNALCGNGTVPVWLHMLRGMAVVDAGYPFASVDSTDIARNHNRGGDSLELKQARARRMAERWDSIQSAPRWEISDQLELEAA